MLKENISLKEFTTMKTGGVARYFFCVKSIKEIKEAVVFAKRKNLSIFILGGGSNVLVSDDGFAGVVIKMEIVGIDFEDKNKKEMTVIAGAGVVWDFLVEQTISKDLFGLENLSAIPGTVGASPVQNIGAYGVEVCDMIDWVEVLDIETMDIKKIMSKECLFNYRESFFKSIDGRKFIILKVAFNLKKNGELKTKYKDIEEYFFKKNIKPTLKTLRCSIVKIRKDKLPEMKKLSTAGSFFKNPIVSKEKIKELLKTYPKLKYFPVADKLFKLSAGWLIDEIGNWKGVCIGRACVYEKHSLVLVGNEGVTTKEILILAKKIQNSIKEKIEVTLEFEVNII